MTIHIKHMYALRTYFLYLVYPETIRPPPSPAPVEVEEHLDFAVLKAAGKGFS